MSYALKLKELRENKGLSQRELALILNIGVSTVGMWESTKQMPPAARLIQLADYFGVTVDSLLGRENNLLTYNNHEITDKQTVDFMKLYKVMSEIQKAQVFGYVVALLESAGVNVKAVLGY